ncbi:TetR/AcrR family transcriptional regulator [Geminicoccus roseus]|uniref:TetR/AcrR family transcriptional regulator n=1 Tax=Geminicoccus roseus TaxID=404900 RepID=UPI00040D019B|nr:TetR/AcrR family transcriptional regulator [Geminicoccus roseus]
MSRASEAEPITTGKSKDEAAPARTPRARDPKITSGRILAAAKTEFARKGLAGARVDTIAARAKINKRMIYHYFKSKEDLYLCVLEEAYGDLRRAERLVDFEGREPEDAIVALVEFTWGYYRANPELLRLIVTENIHQARYLKRSKKIREMHSPFVALIGDLLDRGVRKGVFRAGIDPNQLYISIAALGFYYLNNRWTLSVIYGVDLGAEPEMEKRRAAMVDTILSYLRSNPAL